MEAASARSSAPEPPRRAARGLDKSWESSTRTICKPTRPLCGPRRGIIYEARRTDSPARADFFAGKRRRATSGLRYGRNVPPTREPRRALSLSPPLARQKMFKFYNSLKIGSSPVDSAGRACYNVRSGYPVVCATPVLLPTDSKKDSGSVSVDAMPPISDRSGKAANGRRSPPCLSGG